MGNASIGDIQELNIWTFKTEKVVPFHKLEGAGKSEDSFCISISGM